MDGWRANAWDAGAVKNGGFVGGGSVLPGAWRGFEGEGEVEMIEFGQGDEGNGIG